MDFVFGWVKTNLGEYTPKVSCLTGECIQNYASSPEFEAQSSSHVLRWATPKEMLPFLELFLLFLIL